MWSARVQALDSVTTKTVLSAGSNPLTYGEVIRLWQDDEAFRTFFNSTITESEFGSFFWETPPITKATTSRPFEFVLVSAPSFAGLAPDPAAFAEHFSSNPGKQVVTFSNLAGDATLVVPAPLTANRVYTHLAPFLRNAPAEQIGALWRQVGLALEARLSNMPTWLSTAGMGVSWLHVRLDSRPKYYRHEPYRSATS